MMYFFELFSFNILPFIFHLEDGERRSQPYSGEYDWLGPDLTRNTRGQYILVFPAVLVTPFLLQSRSEPITITDMLSHYPPSEFRLPHYVYDCTFSARTRSPPMIRGI